jgi:hypothetical protein
MKVPFVFLAITAITCATSLECKQLFDASQFSRNLNETIAHAVHSMTVQGLQLFNPRATENNAIPTVNLDRSSSKKVLEYAPSYPVGGDFSTHSMNLVDRILSEIGNAKDGLGPMWSPVERIAHTFHMWDLWNRIRQVYTQVLSSPPSDAVCTCLTNVKDNGIYQAVGWVSEHYQSTAPLFSLLNRPVTKFKDGNTWKMWKNRLLYYYDDGALYDTANYLYCATKNF